jgi:hypothetical protein
MPTWPLSGIWLFLRSPRWWARPLVASLLGWLTLLGLAIAMLWWRWPAAETSGWSWWWQSFFAIGLAGAAMVAGWLLVLPILMSLAMESLARQAMRSAGVEPVELPVWRSVGAGLRVMGNTLPMRLGWAGGSVVLGFVAGPVGAVVGAIGMGQVACLDALDLALSLRGYDGLTRLRILANRKRARMEAGMLAGVANLLAATTILLWPLWLPGLVVGAAREVATWDLDGAPR